VRVDVADCGPQLRLKKQTKGEFAGSSEVVRRASEGLRVFRRVATCHFVGKARYQMTQRGRTAPGWPEPWLCCALAAKADLDLA